MWIRGMYIYKRYSVVVDFLFSSVEIKYNFRKCNEVSRTPDFSYLMTIRDEIIYHTGRYATAGSHWY
jgi:hypothetical protein